jgi:iduronate 2-sulfatase
VAEYCGLKAPHTLAGQSLRPLIENPSGKSRGAAFTLVTRGQRQYGQSVRTDRWRYTRWSDGTAELYDESADPQENHNLAGDAKHQAQTAELAKRLDTLPPFKNESP